MLIAVNAAINLEYINCDFLKLQLKNEAQLLPTDRLNAVLVETMSW